MINNNSQLQLNSSHKLFSPQPMKLNPYFDANSSYMSLSPSFEAPQISAFSVSSSPYKKLFSSPDCSSQPLYLEEINRLRADSMNQLENEINRCVDGRNDQVSCIDNDLLLQQLEEDFANFPFQN